MGEGAASRAAVGVSMFEGSATAGYSSWLLEIGHASGDGSWHVVDAPTTGARLFSTYFVGQAT